MPISLAFFQSSDSDHSKNKKFSNGQQVLELEDIDKKLKEAIEKD